MTSLTARHQHPSEHGILYSPTLYTEAFLITRRARLGTLDGCTRIRLKPLFLRPIRRCWPWHKTHCNNRLQSPDKYNLDVRIWSAENW
jgi:hypothetical protein